MKVAHPIPTLNLKGKHSMRAFPRACALHPPALAVMRSPCQVTDRAPLTVLDLVNSGSIEL